MLVIIQTIQQSLYMDSRGLLYCFGKSPLSVDISCGLNEGTGIRLLMWCFISFLRADGNKGLAWQDFTFTSRWDPGLMGSNAHPVTGFCHTDEISCIACRFMPAIWSSLRERPPFTSVNVGSMLDQRPQTVAQH